MTRNVGGYGRYDDDPEHIGCPRAATDMTPCIARDGHTALADDLTCVGCSSPPTILLAELDRAAGGVTIISSGRRALGAHKRMRVAADAVARRVRQLTEPGGRR